MSENYIAIYSSKVENPEITIAIPTYKRSELLFEAILSAVNQETLVKYDIIVVDNNPERGDETEQLMEKFRDSSLVSYYKNLSNIGMVGNWNQLFNIAKGQWVAMLHDDDLLYPNYIDIIKKSSVFLNKVDVIIPERKTSSIRGNQNSSLPSYVEIQQIAPKYFILGNIIGPPVGMCVRRSFYFKTSGFRQDMFPSIDFDFYITASQLGGFYLLKHKLCTYYIGANESLKKEVIIGFFLDAKRISKRLSLELKFPYNIVNRLCYRWMINDVVSWTKFFGSEAVIQESLSIINFKNNNLLNRLSTFFAKVVRKIFNFTIKSNSVTINL